MAKLTTIELYKLQFPLSTDIDAENPTDPQITAYIESVSESVQEYLNRDLQNKLRSEWHTTFDDNVLITNQYPINQIYGIFAGKEEWAQLRLTNEDDIVSLNFYNNSDNVSLSVYPERNIVREPCCLDVYPQATKTLCKQLFLNQN